MENLLELDKTEAQSINGGSGPTCHWTGRIFGAVSRFFDDVFNDYSSTPEGQAVQQALQDFH
jgi:hypothetical protein